MDLGCIDMGCVEKPRKETSIEKDNSPKESSMSASKLGKNNKAKDAVRSSLNALNKLTSQISKPSHRKTSSPLNWFPRKKVEPYLKRKIKMLQEVDGMHSTLDETLGDSNPHYCRVLREKIAIKEAAEKAMEARKAAMVEASWCRILQAARIESKEAEAQLSKAELSAAEAFEAARTVGVIMNDIPDSQNHFKIETSSAKGGESTTHTVSATFETAFEVDKQVAGAVKAAFIKLANCPSINKDEFKELLRRISENPDTDENHNATSDFASECDAGSELETGKDSSNHQNESCCNKESDKFSTSNIVDMMLGRLRCLKEDELGSLATIVATSGLNAALSSAVENTENACLKVVPRRMSQTRGTAGDELPSLDKFLVKRLTRLEREVLEAKNARKNEAVDDNKSSTEVKLEDGTIIPDLGSVLVKRSSKLEKEVEEARMKRKSSEIENKKFQRAVGRVKQDVEDVPSLDKFLVKRLTRLEREVLEARNGKKTEPTEGEKVVDSIKTTTSIADAANSEETPFSSNGDSKGKENVDLNKINNSNIGSSFSHQSKDGGNADANYESLDQVLVKHVSRLEKEKQDFCAYEQTRTKMKRKDASRELESGEGSLDQVLVKHVSRLEKEKLEFCADEQARTRMKRKDASRELENGEGSLEQVLVKHKSRLEREKIAANVEQQEEDDVSTRHSVSRRQAREKELQAAWGGLSLGNSMRPHVSRLQRDKAEWIKAEEDERKRAIEEEV